MHSYFRTSETAKFLVERRLRVSAKYLIRRSGISPPSRLVARSAPAPRERKEVYHKSPPLWAKRFVAEKMPPASGAMLLHRGLFLGSDRTFHLRLNALLHVGFSCPSLPCWQVCRSVRLPLNIKRLPYFFHPKLISVFCQSQFSGSGHIKILQKA